jgi:hypothetical protein
MIVIGIDPGPEKSAICVFDALFQRVLESSTEDNGSILATLREKVTRQSEPMHLAIERITSYGRPVGETVFETVFWTGVFYEAWTSAWRTNCTRIIFREVGVHLCNAGSQVKESHVRQALIDRFGPDPKVAKGTKDNPGPLYGVANHQWSALAVAVTIGDRLANH